MVSSIMKAWHMLLGGTTLVSQQVLCATNNHSVAHFPFNISRHSTEGDANYTAPVYPLLPFKKYSSNPILRPIPENTWESRYLYNPTAIVLDETIFLIYRAQPKNKTSSLGLAWSTDGTTFTRLSRPILTATEAWEQGGGTEDPRIVRVNGTFYLTYTAFDNHTARLCMATSENLLDWKKHAPLIPFYYDYPPGRNAPVRFNWTKSGAIIAERQADGLFHMIFGDSDMYEATSPDLLRWTATPSEQPYARGASQWEDLLIEPGPAPIKTREGRWLLVYNGQSSGAGGYTRGQYSVGQMLLDPGWRERSAPGTISQHQKHDSGLVTRLRKPCLVPEADNEKDGQVNNVVFAEGLVQYKGKWYMYYGQADSDLGVAIADVQP